jgi:hypothetical protein
MTPEQALQFLKQALVLRPGLSLDDCAGVVSAWNTLAESVQKGKGDGGPSKEGHQEDKAQIQTSRKT